jgi:hypothetical protein
LWLLAPQVLGASLQLIEGLPSSYVPGQPVAFDVRLPAISNLGSYNIDLVLEGSSGVAGTDFFFDVAATFPAGTNYVFPSSANFFAAANVDLPTRHRITLTDFEIVGANVVPDQNDRVGTVVLRTVPGFDSPLSLFIDAPSLILDTPAMVPTPVSNYDAIRSDIAAAGPIGLLPVPEQRFVLNMMTGLAWLLVFRPRNARQR